MTEPVCFYFGRLDQPGHYWYVGRPSTIPRSGGPVGLVIGGDLCPRDGVERSAAESPPGLARLTNLYNHQDAWTIISFWDRSGDRRPGSNSNFVVAGSVTFDAAVTIAKAAFPDLWKRFPFEGRQEPIPGEEQA